MDGFKLVLASDGSTRDGMGLELETDDGEQVAEVFEDTESKVRRVTFYKRDPVPLEAGEWLLDSARTKL
jgi:hypothetical protein